jgi:hypothetical protein
MDKLTPNQALALNAVKDGRLVHVTDGTGHELGYHIKSTGSWAAMRKAHQRTYETLAELEYIDDADTNVKLTTKGWTALTTR